MVSEKVILPNRLGLHMRPAGVFCKEALKHSCEIKIIKDNHTANGKSILSILALQIRYMNEFEISCNGNDEEDVLKVLVDLVKSGLGDPPEDIGTGKI